MKLVDQLDNIWTKLLENGFKVSTDTREEISGTIFFALKGENYDGNSFVRTALDGRVMAVVTQDTQFATLPNVFVVKDPLEVLQKLARRYRERFKIPIIAIGGSNGKTTSRELIRSVLETKYQIHTTSSNLNNEIGLPLSILSMSPATEIGLFEIGANHLGEHTKLLEILNPTHTIVTNTGLDHLEGFGSPEKVKEANEEINIWSNKNGATILKTDRHNLTIATSLPLSIKKDGQVYLTHLIGDYNLENINRALSIGLIFGIDTVTALDALKNYSPTSKRSAYLERDGINFVMDCYNANPTSMKLSLKSFLSSTSSPRGVILGDMLELGSYSRSEHKKIVDYIARHQLEEVVFVGPQFKKTLKKTNLKHHWFENSIQARTWFEKQDFTNFTFLLKGSRGMKIEQVLNL